MLAQLCLIVSAVFAGDVTLANGIRLVEAPSRSESFEIVAGYHVENGPLAPVASTFLASTRSVRTMAMTAYGAGGQFELISDLDRIAVRVTGPLWAKPAIENELANFFAETAERDPLLVERAFAAQTLKPPADFRTAVENTLRDALLGVPTDTEAAGGLVQFRRFFDANFGTDRAFVLSSAPVAELLGPVAPRPSIRAEAAGAGTRASVREFRYKPDLAAGAVIVASPSPAIYYEGWYAVLLLDRLIQRTLPGVTSSLLPSVEPYYYRLEVPVPEGQFDDVVEGRLIEDLERLQFTHADPQDLEAARVDAIRFLEEDAIQRWFRSLGLDSRRLEGIERIRSLTPDDVRAAARDVVADRVVASWSPKPKQVTIEIESLDAPEPATPAGDGIAPLADLSAISIPVFPPHSHNFPADVPPERLASSVTVASGTAHAIFVAPKDLKVFDHEPGADDLKPYEQYRPQRILVMAPPAALSRVKAQWASFKGNPRDTLEPAAIGRVANIDLPALVVLMMVLNRRIIEAGMWNDVQLEISAGEGSELKVRGADAARLRVSPWIRSIARDGVPADELAWAWEAAVHHLEQLKPHLQSLLWQRDGQTVLPDLPTIAVTQIQDVARIYFE